MVLYGVYVSICVSRSILTTRLIRMIKSGLADGNSLFFVTGGEKSKAKENWELTRRERYARVTSFKSSRSSFAYDKITKNSYRHDHLSVLFYIF